MHLEYFVLLALIVPAVVARVIPRAGTVGVNGDSNIPAIIEDFKAFMEMADSLCDLLSEDNPLNQPCNMIMQFVNKFKEDAGPLLDMIN
ncbi:hypothetical protein PM082_006706 [Marasmius tenuissimus]|nr:hypothetical protein PM082_006706 [Marasmius tenuissimus]